MKIKAHRNVTKHGNKLISEYVNLEFASNSAYNCRVTFAYKIRAGNINKNFNKEIDSLIDALMLLKVKGKDSISTNLYEPTVLA